MFTEVYPNQIKSDLISANGIVDEVSGLSKPDRAHSIILDLGKVTAEG